MSIDLIKAIIYAVFSGVAYGAFSAYLKHKGSRKDPEPSPPPPRTANAASPQPPFSDGPTLSPSLVEKFAELIPWTIRSPSDAPFGTVIASIGGVVVGLVVVPFVWQSYLAINQFRLDFASIALLMAVVLYFGFAMIRSGYRSHSRDNASGRQNANTILNLQKTFVHECPGFWDLFKKKSEKR